MKKLFVIFIIIGSACASSGQTSTVTTFILVRHAEKGDDGTKDPDLKPEGVERSRKLADMLKDTPLDAIYATNYKRTQNTVQPIAAIKGMKVESYEAFKDDVIQSMLKKHAGGTILICGHSNNIPWTANLLIGKEEYKDYADTNYGTILIVSVVEKGKTAKVTLLRY